MLYPLFKSIAFRFDPEWVHEQTLHRLQRWTRPGKLSFWAGDIPEKPVKVMGLEFSNPVGLAAGMDKNGLCVEGFGSLGFGFLELGTVTPRPQPGNAKPRLFRIPEREAIINRMGFNNEGVEALLQRLEGVRYSGIIGINIGKNADTPIEHAAEDYRLGLKAVYKRADYVTVNISSPNTSNLRELQKGQAFSQLLNTLSETREQCESKFGKRTPIAIKIAPDLDAEAVAWMADTVEEAGMDAIIATNTTLDREGVADCRHGREAGGLSGVPLREKSTKVIRQLHERLDGRLPIIGVGGIYSAEDAREKLQAGATLVQVYSGLIYRGPGLVGDIIRGI